MAQLLHIVGLVGMLDFPKSDDWLWSKFRAAFESRFPGAEFTVEHALYLPWQKRRIERYIQSIVTKYDTGADIIFVGYSLGGVIACAASPHFMKSRVRLIATIASPHRPRLFHHMLGSQEFHLQTRIPVVSFGAWLDPVVPYFASRFQSSLSHRNFWGDHLFWFLLSRRPAQFIAKTVREAVGSNGG